MSGLWFWKVSGASGCDSGIVRGATKEEALYYARMAFDASDMNAVVKIHEIETNPNSPNIFKDDPPPPDGGVAIGQAPSLNASMEAMPRLDTPISVEAAMPVVQIIGSRMADEIDAWMKRNNVSEEAQADLRNTLVLITMDAMSGAGFISKAKV